ncbi:MAG TPA: hypothetical protein VKE69_10470, partial [Planctomycetota bacterium]|nr:hypothetical protein [Planctomycetota bacterium]
MDRHELRACVPAVLGAASGVEHARELLLGAVEIPLEFEVEAQIQTCLGEIRPKLEGFFEETPRAVAEIGVGGKGPVEQAARFDPVVAGVLALAARDDAAHEAATAQRRRVDGDGLTEDFRAVLAVRRDQQVRLRDSIEHRGEAAEHAATEETRSQSSTALAEQHVGRLDVSFGARERTGRDRRNVAMRARHRADRSEEVLARLADLEVDDETPSGGLVDLAIRERGQIDRERLARIRVGGAGVGAHFESRRLSLRP